MPIFLRAKTARNGQIYLYISIFWSKVFVIVATHLRYFPVFGDLTKKVDKKLAYFAMTPESILGLMGKYLPSLGTEWLNHFKIVQNL